MINKLTDLINATPIEPEEPRNYIGASSIGNPCERAIYYGYIGAERSVIDARRQRILDIGKTLEKLMLFYISESVLSRFPIGTEYREKRVPQFRGHVDAVLNDAILEIKTAKDSSFRVFEKHGLRKWYPAYYAQVQAYMGMSSIHTAYVLALNKDTSELRDERVEFDSDYYEQLVAKAAKIVEMVEAPNRINDNPAFFMCKICDFRKVCHR